LDLRVPIGTSTPDTAVRREARPFAAADLVASVFLTVAMDGSPRLTLRQFELIGP
jgi:hypothetical protein